MKSRSAYRGGSKSFNLKKKESLFLLTSCPRPWAKSRGPTTFSFFRPRPTFTPAAAGWRRPTTTHHSKSLALFFSCLISQRPTTPGQPRICFDEIWSEKVQERSLSMFRKVASVSTSGPDNNERQRIVRVLRYSALGCGSGGIMGSIFIYICEKIYEKISPRCV